MPEALVWATRPPGEMTLPAGIVRRLDIVRLRGEERGVSLS
jgi:hypothetical protein